MKRREKMAENDKNERQDLDFWNLDQYIKKRPSPAHIKQFSKSATEAVTIETQDGSPNVYVGTANSGSHFSDSRLSVKRESDTDSTITRFIPPHKDPAFAKKYVIVEYFPENPLIKSVKVCSEKPDERVFVDTNLFIRERRALLNRKATESPYVSYYSYSPRYSQMNRAQLSYYLWWRENTRNGIFLKADESYIILYAYELAATGEGKDKEAALDMLCALLQNYTDRDVNAVYRLMIRDLICDFCLVHGLSSPTHKLGDLGSRLLSGAFLPEFFIDLSERNRSSALEMGLASISMYDYRRSKFYSDETSELFKKAMNGAIAAIFSDDAAFKSITSFTDGVYGCVTAERRPFARMINIVNRSIKLEITYYQLSNIQSAVTDAMRYSENKLREYMGIKNKLHIMSINPYVKATLDAYFAKNYPAMPTVDRRRKANVNSEPVVNEYDKFYDVPKTEISPERALEIERDSWSTTKILTEAFSDDTDIKTEENEPLNAPQLIIEPIGEPVPQKAETTVFSLPTTPQSQISGGLLAQIMGEIGEVAEFIELCKSPTPMEQRRFASSHGLSVDEIADSINECAANVFGDIILEDVGGAYRIIEDYIDQF